jgi:hypothetical protein
VISQQEWAEFESALSEFNDEVGKQALTWKRVTIDLDRFGEDSSPTHEEVTLEALVSYNAFRVWPMGVETDPGMVDNQYCYLLLNNKYLSDNGWLTAQNNFDFNPTEDLFIINGIEYISKGDTPISQDINKPLYTIIVLERKSPRSGTIARP